jgi:hypothetical protein
MDDETSPPGVARVARTGIALVHEGELILSAPGSDAEFEQVDSDSRTVVQYFFPVEIEVCASAAPIDVDHLANLTLGRLAMHLASTQDLDTA